MIIYTPCSHCDLLFDYSHVFRIPKAENGQTKLQFCSADCCKGYLKDREVKHEGS